MIETEEVLVQPDGTPMLEDVEELLFDCHGFVNALLERQQSKWVVKDGARLLKRLATLVDFHTIH